MANVFYRSSTDGWRLGSAELNNTNKVVVTDNKLHVQETCRVSDIYMPPEGSAQLLHMSDKKQEYLHKSDMALMSPTPLVALPSVIELLRLRWSARRFTVSIGDNVDIVLHERNEEMMSNEEMPVQAMMSKVVAALRASGASQVVAASGRVPARTSAELSQAILQEARASTSLQARVAAALTVLNAFTNTIRGEARYIRHVSFDFPAEDQNGSRNRVSSARIQHFLLNLRHFGLPGGCDDNFRIFSMLIYAFNHEEKERVQLNRKQTDFQTQRVIKDLDVIADFRRQYVEFSKALETVGIEFAARLSLYARISAVLHLLEVEFFEDGSPSNLTAIKSIARLLQLDFNAATKMFHSKDVCVAAAKWLYEATFIALCEKVNLALGAAIPTTAPMECSITLVVMPPPPQPPLNSAFLAPADLSLATLYEDLSQCYLRSTEAESIQWQRAGLLVPDTLQSLLDKCDNFPVLKAIKGRNGVLHCARIAGDATLSEADRRAPLQALCKSPVVQSYPPEWKVTVPHSFGTRTYQFVYQSTSIGPTMDTIYHDRYSDFRDFLMSNSDVETQEVLYFFDQNREKQASVLAEDATQLRPLVDLFQDASQHFWWIKGVELEVNFDGLVVEEQIKSTHLSPVIELRRVFPKCYISCKPSFATNNYGKLLRADQRSLPPMQQAESILSNANVSYLVTPEQNLLVEGRMLLTLQNVHMDYLNRCAAVVQSFARVHVTSRFIRARFLSWRDAVAQLDHQRDAVVERHRALLENTELYKLQQYELVEKEATARVLIRDQCWVEWVAFQTSAQEQLQSLLQKMVALSIKKEESSIKVAVSKSRKTAVTQLMERIQDRLLAQGSHLDHVVSMKEQQHAAAYRRLEREYETHKRLMAKKVEEEESRLEVKQSLANKGTRILKVNVEREKQREELRQKLWFRQEKDRVAREQMERTRTMIKTNLEEQIAFETIERKMAKRVAEEVALEQKRLRVEQEQAIREAKRQREEQLVATAKENERLLAKKEKQQQRREEAEAARRRKTEQELLLAQERERRAFDRIKREEDRQNKALTRSLLKAHDLLQNPLLFEHTAEGAVHLIKGHARGTPKHTSPGAGFVLSNGKETYPRLLPEQLASGLIDSSSPRLASASPYRNASVARSQRDFSPRSNFSL